MEEALSFVKSQLLFCCELLVFFEINKTKYFGFKIYKSHVLFLLFLVRDNI